MVERWLMLVLLMSSVFTAESPSAKPTLDYAATPAQVAVGDPLTVTVTWTWPTGWTATHEPDPAVDFRDCFVTDAPPLKSMRTAEGERRELTLKILANRSGAWALPRPILSVTGPQGPLTLTAPEVIIQVGPEAAPAKLPEPIALRVRPPASLTNDHRWWWAGGALAVLALGATVFALRRRVDAAAAIPPAERFATELRQLAALSDGKELGAGISLALRRYAGEVYRFDGAGATTREVATQLAIHTQADDERRQLVRLLERLDDLRWAAGELDVTLVRPLSEDANAWVASVERRLAAERAAALANKSREAKP